MPRHQKPASLFGYFNSSPKIVRKALVMYVRFRLSERKVENLQAEPAIDIIHETVGPWRNRIGSPDRIAISRNAGTKEPPSLAHWLSGGIPWPKLP
jgi:putative transposase